MSNFLMFCSGQLHLERWPGTLSLPQFFHLYKWPDEHFLSVTHSTASHHSPFPPVTLFLSVYTKWLHNHNDVTKKALLYNPECAQFSWLLHTPFSPTAGLCDERPLKWGGQGRGGIYPILHPCHIPSHSRSMCVQCKHICTEPRHMQITSHVLAIHLHNSLILCRDMISVLYVLHAHLVQQVMSDISFQSDALPPPPPPPPPQSRERVWDVHYFAICSTDEGGGGRQQDVLLLYILCLQLLEPLTTSHTAPTTPHTASGTSYHSSTALGIVHDSK